MSDSVVPTPSEKSTIYKCVCRYSGTNVKTRKDGEDDYWTCPGCKTEYGPVKPYPGPVIATEPETPSYIPNLSTDGQQKPCDARCGHDNHRIGCLNDPASEATCEVHLEKDGRLRVTTWVRPDQMYATLSAMQSIASDPAPEIRERANELSRTLRLIKRLAIEHDTEIVLGHEYVDDLLLILDALKGEPK